MNIDRNYIINEFKRIAKELGKQSISRREFLSNSNVSEWHILKIFGSYNDAVIAAGLKPIPKAIRPSPEEIFEEMFRVFNEEGHICSALEFGRKSKFSRDLPARVFGSWEKALLSFSEWMKTSGRDIQSISFPLDKKKPSIESAAKRDKRIEIGKKDIQDIAYESIGSSRYGSFINFRGLLHAPINEQGVVFLFGMVCFELGFVIEVVRSDFPDCEGKRRIDRKKDYWERVRIEFEYRSSNFKEHEHNPSECDLIVCWEHDWEECPIEVIELKSVITNLET